MASSKTLSDLTLRSWAPDDEACRRIGSAGVLRRVWFADVSEASLEWLASQPQIKEISVGESALGRGTVHEIASRHPDKAIWRNGVRITPADDSGTKK